MFIYKQIHYKIKHLSYEDKMNKLKMENIQNLDNQNVQELINKFRKREQLNIVDISEIISELINTLKLDYDSGRPKIHGSISGGHLGNILGIGKGVISQYMSIYNMPMETKEFLRNYNLSVMNGYHVSRIKGKDETETIKLQKDLILQKCMSSGTGNKTDILIHRINESKMILNSIIVSQNVPLELSNVGISPHNNINDIRKFAISLINNIDECIKYICPRLSKLSYLKKELEFCNILLHNNIENFCNTKFSKETVENQIKSVSLEISSIEDEEKQPHIASLIMMKNNLEKII